MTSQWKPSIRGDIINWIRGDTTIVIIIIIIIIIFIIIIVIKIAFLFCIAWRELCSRTRSLCQQMLPSQSMSPGRDLWGDMWPHHCEVQLYLPCWLHWSAVREKTSELRRSGKKWRHYIWNALPVRFSKQHFSSLLRFWFRSWLCLDVNTVTLAC